MAKSPIKRRRKNDSGVWIAPDLFLELLAGLEQKQVDVDRFLRLVGVNPLSIRKPGSRGMTPMQYTSLLNALVSDQKDECLGLLSRPFKPGSFALTVRAGLSATDLRRALKRMGAALNLLQDDIVFSLQIRGDEAGMHMQEADPERGLSLFTQGTFVRVLWRLAAWLLNAPLPVRHFDFTSQKPESDAVYDIVFPATRRYSQQAFGFWFDTSELSAPVYRDEPALLNFLSDAFAQVISPPRYFGTMGNKVRNHLMRSYPAWPTLENVAQKLHTSPSSLQRHLMTENTSFQMIKDDLRRDLAISRLSSSSNVSLVQLALEMGFSDSPTFQRAFKRWTGQTCGEFRRRR